RDPARGTVDLHRGNAEVEQDRVGTRAVFGELLENDGEVAAQEAALDAGLLTEAVEVRPRGRIAVDRDQPAVSTQVRSEQRRMPAGAEGRGHDRLPTAGRGHVP